MPHRVLFALALLALAVGCQGERPKNPAPARPVAPHETAPARDVTDAAGAPDAGAANTPHAPDSTVHEERK